MSVGTGRQNIIILFWKYQFHFWEFINRNQTFILDCHQPYICSGVEKVGKKHCKRGLMKTNVVTEKKEKNM
jgi:hypothetical protein